MKRLFILTTFLLGISPICLNAQELTLEECQQQAQAHYPLIKRYGLIEKTKEYNISNAGKGYLPQVSLSAKASYQSDVTEIPVDLPGIDIRGIRKDQYQAMLQLDQVVWDGGNIRARKEVTRATSEVDKQKLEVDMYAINERVNQLFFGILLLKEQLKQNQLMQEELQRNYDNVAAYVKNGIANQADLDAVKVEQLNNIQQRHTLEATYRAYGEMLKIMINHPTPLTENTLKKPDVNALLYKGEAYSTEFIRRPELNLFATQNQQLEAQRKQLTAKNLPRLDLFDAFVLLYPHFSPTPVRNVGNRAKKRTGRRPKKRPQVGPLYGGDYLERQRTTSHSDTRSSLCFTRFLLLAIRNRLVDKLVECCALLGGADGSHDWIPYDVAVLIDDIRCREREQI